LICEIQDDIIMESDQDMLETILRNLLSNALKFTPSPGMITINASIQMEDIEISISDTGIGISELDCEKLFSIDSNLQSRKGTENESGSGLGLILCKEFIDKLNGTILLKSEPGQGTTFKFTIPMNIN